jgi:hypothetical protein
MAQTKRGGELPLDAGADATDTADELETKVEARADATGADLVDDDNLELADVALLGQLMEVTATGQILDEDGKAVAAPTAVVAADGPSIVGNAVVSFPSKDGVDPALVNVLATVLNFPVATVAKSKERVLKPAVNTAYVPFIDTVSGVVREGQVPTESGVGHKIAQMPAIGDRNLELNDAFFELSTGLYWIVTTAGDPIKDGTANRTLPQFKAYPPVVKENLDDWDKVWAPQGPSFDYEAAATKSFTAVGARSVAVTLPADPSNFGSWDEAVVAGAAKRLLPTDATFVSGAVPLKKCDTDAEWAAKFEQMYVKGKTAAVIGTGTTDSPQFPAKPGTVHPSAVSALIAAFYETLDARPDAVVLNKAGDAAVYLTGVTESAIAKDVGLTGDLKGGAVAPVQDIKPFGLYDGGNLVLGDGNSDAEIKEDIPEI